MTVGLTSSTVGGRKNRKYRLRIPTEIDHQATGVAAHRAVHDARLSRRVGARLDSLLAVGAVLDSHLAVYDVNLFPIVVRMRSGCLRAGRHAQEPRPGAAFRLGIEFVREELHGDPVVAVAARLEAGLQVDGLEEFVLARSAHGNLSNPFPG